MDTERPNFLIILADDLGWSDIGIFGSEISTPNIDELADNGIAMSQFYVAPVCAPTRAMLLTGVDNHAAGVGVLDGLQAPNQLDSHRYAAQLHNGVVTVAEGLKVAGYQTFMAGKWHLSLEPEQQPHRRGFDRSFALLQGGASHFADRSPLAKGTRVDYIEDGRPVELKENFYSTTAYADKIIEYISSAQEDAPFFAYLAFTAPHDPLQVPDAWLNRYEGAYDEGPTAIREHRMARIRANGLFPANSELWRLPAFPPWLPLFREDWWKRSEQERAREVRPMEIYAAMIELMDQEIGRVIDHLESTDQLKNTYVIFMSDNGANGTTPLVYPGNTREWFLASHGQQLEEQGKAGSYVFLDAEWASAAVSPWKMYKGTVGEGGIRAPLIAAGPGVHSGRILDQVSSVTDLTPTFYELAKIDPNREALYLNKILPQGTSLLPSWLGEEPASDHVVNVEIFGNRAVRQGKWKASNILAPRGSGHWELYDMSIDPGEVHDVATQYPDVLKGMVESYQAYAKENGVIQPNPPMKTDLRQLYAGECEWWCDFRFQLTNALVKVIAFIRDLFGP